MKKGQYICLFNVHLCYVIYPYFSLSISQLNPPTYSIDSIEMPSHLHGGGTAGPLGGSGAH